MFSCFIIKVKTNFDVVYLVHLAPEQKFWLHRAKMAFIRIQFQRIKMADNELQFRETQLFAESWFKLVTRVARLVDLVSFGILLITADFKNKMDFWNVI